MWDEPHTTCNNVNQCIIITCQKLIVPIRVVEPFTIIVPQLEIDPTRCQFYFLLN